LAAAAAPAPLSTAITCPQARCCGLSPEFCTGRATGMILLARSLSGEDLTTVGLPLMASS